MTVVTLYWLGKIGVYRCKYPSVLTKLHALVALLLPISLALWIAASRVRNHFHHPADVVTGGLLGYICAQAATRLWYPSIGDRDQAGIPIVPHVTMETDREESTAGGYVYGSHHDGS
jgi:membrane-associated phospholipid phosphatase